MSEATGAAKQPLHSHNYSQERVKEMRDVAIELRALSRRVSKLASLLDDLSFALDEKEKGQKHSGPGLSLRS